MATRRRTAGKLLRAAARGDSADVLGRVEELAAESNMRDEVIRGAAYHGVVPLLARALRAGDAPGDWIAAVSKLYRSQTSQVLRLEVMLGEAVGALTEAGIRSAVFKGPALAHGYYRSPEERVYSDIDLLVGCKDMVKADTVLGEAGFKQVGIPVSEALRIGYGEVTYAASNGTTLDLHWHVQREPQIRRAFSLSTEDMLARAVSLKVGSCTVPSLDSEDLLIAVALHACYDGIYRLGWLVDVERTFMSGRVSQRELVERCRRSGVGLPVQVVLDRSAHTLGVQLAGVVGRSAWRALLIGLATVRPVEQTFEQIMRGGILYRSTRESAVRSAAAFCALAIVEGATPLLTDPRHRWRRSRRARER